MLPINDDSQIEKLFPAGGVAHRRSRSAVENRENPMYALVFYVPESHVEDVKQALFDAGAGRIGDYRRCCWQVLGSGQFEPTQNSRPFLGRKEQLERVDEFRVEMVCDDASIESVIRALCDAHPYEEPAFHHWLVNEARTPGSAS